MPLDATKILIKKNDPYTADEAIKHNALLPQISRFAEFFCGPELDVSDGSIESKCSIIQSPSII